MALTAAQKSALHEILGLPEVPHIFYRDNGDGLLVEDHHVESSSRQALQVLNNFLDTMPAENLANVAALCNQWIALGIQAYEVDSNGTKFSTAEMRGVIMSKVKCKIPIVFQRAEIGSPQNRPMTVSFNR